jgi:PEP-CTERM/exosortase A-associated glycosyltransferase
MSLRVLHILDHSLPLQSGYSFRTVSILREQRALGWETHHLTTPKQGQFGPDEETVDGWHFFRTTQPPQHFSSVWGLREWQQMQATAARIEDVVNRLRPDILHAHSPVLNALPALKVGRRFKIPVVYELRALWEDAAVDHGTTREGSMQYRLSRYLETFALSKADEVTTICEGLRAEIVSRGISSDKVTVIPNAVDPVLFRVNPQADNVLRSRLGLEGHVILGFIGSFYAYEGVDLLIDAIRLLIAKRTDTRVLLVGGGPAEDALRARVSESGLGSHVTFAGRVPHHEIAGYYEAIDLLVYPRKPMRLTELVTPLKPLEAMAQGRVVIASDVGGHRELIKERETGFLFHAGDAARLAATIEEALALRSQWEGIRSRARRYIENERSWSGSIARYADVYGRALSKSGRSSLAASSTPLMK